MISLINIPSEGRYTMPILPALAIAVTYAISQQRKKISLIIFTIMIFGLFLGFLNITYGKGRLNAYAVPISSPQNADWKIKEILSYINEVNPNAKIFTAFNLERFNAHNFAVEAVKNNYNLSIGYYFNSLESPDYFILKSKQNTVDLNFDKIYNYVTDNELELVNSFNLPDGSIASIYRK
jgi:hypothetical protein